jgi:DNA-binding protein HU-beta
LTKWDLAYINRFDGIAERTALGRRQSQAAGRNARSDRNIRGGIRMNKAELITAVAESAGIKKVDAEKALKAFVDVVTEELVKGEKVQLVGFGTFEISERPERTGRNPQTKKPITIPASRAPKFKAGKALKDAVNA